MHSRAFPEEDLAITAALLAHLNKLPDFQHLQLVEKQPTDHPAAWPLFFETVCIGLLRRNSDDGLNNGISYLLFSPT